MQFCARQLIRVSTTFLLVFILLTATSSRAQTHVVSQADLAKAATAASDARAHSQSTLDNALSSPQAEKALRAVHLDAEQVKNAVSSLNDQELRDLAARADHAQADFAAGRLSDRDLIWIIVAIAALILIIVAVR